MSDEELLKMIENDNSGLLDIEKKVAPITSSDRLVDSFLEINNFFRENNAEPVSGKDIYQHKLASRLKHIRDNVEQKFALVTYDEFGLLTEKNKLPEIDNLKDLFEDDDLGLLDTNDTGIFSIKNVPVVIEKDRADADFVATRKKCEDFTPFEGMFINCQNDLRSGKRKLGKFIESDMREGDFYVLNGILIYLDRIDEPYRGNSQKINRRTRTIYENGTESNALLRSLGKLISEDGYAVSRLDIESDDQEMGYIYILKSLSTDPQILSVKDLYKIGFSTTSVEKRIENAKEDPTYLMAQVEIVSTFKCFNMNPQKLERLLHRFFSNSCLNIDITDKNQNRYTPKEWFIAPIDVIERAIHLMISGDIVNYRFDKDIMAIVQKSSELDM